MLKFFNGYIIAFNILLAIPNKSMEINNTTYTICTVCFENTVLTVSALFIHVLKTLESMLKPEGLFSISEILVCLKIIF